MDILLTLLFTTILLLMFFLFAALTFPVSDISEELGKIWLLFEKKIASMLCKFRQGLDIILNGDKGDE